MEIECLGVGEAFDPKLGNASYIIHSETKLLIDCGYAIPRNFFEKKYSKDFIDAIYLTHFHADHTFGFPAVLFRWFEEGRKKPLTVIGQKGTKDHFIELIHMAYPNLVEKLDYTLNYIETMDPCTFNELSLSFALTAHTLSNYAIKIEKEGTCIGFSGDGALTEASKALFQDCDTLVHEAYMFDEEKYGHESASVVVSYGKTLKNLKNLVLVHIQRDEREKRKEDFLKLSDGFEVIVPEPGERL